MPLSIGGNELTKEMHWVPTTFSMRTRAKQNDFTMSSDVLKEEYHKEGIKEEVKRMTTLIRESDGTQYTT
jgi:hypothetical protein